MAFFENLKGKALETLKAAEEKTSIMVETTRINGLINTENKQINSNLLRIGEICYESYPEVISSSIADLVEQINNSKLKIVDYTKQVNKLKGVTKCEQCGTEVVQYNKAFCSNCGAKMSVEDDIAPEGGNHGNDETGNND